MSKTTTEWFFKDVIWGGALFEAAKWLLLTGFPIVIGAIAAYFGFREGLPWAYVIPIVATSFAMTTVGLVAFNAWRFSRTPENKLSFGGVRSGRTSDGKIYLGCILNSRAYFPIEIEITALSASLAKRLPQEQSDFIRKPMRVDMMNSFHFTSAAIDVSGVTDTLLNGDFDATIKYGRPGKRKFTYQVSQKVNVPSDPSLPITASQKFEPNTIETS